jgi:hypothetical protein
MRRFLKDNGLTVVLVLLFALTLFGHSLAGRLEYNEEQRDHGGVEVSYGAYLSTGHFVESVFENWESEFFQMGLYVYLTSLLVQRGSAESKKPRDEPGGDSQEIDEDPATHRDDADAPGPVRRGGWLLRLYSNSLSLAFLFLFVVSVVGHALGGAVEYNADLRHHGQPPVSTLKYLTSSTFWFESLQNWQSEFLAVIGIVVLSIHLRQRGSPESKPVHAPHRQTGA